MWPAIGTIAHVKLADFDDVAARFGPKGFGQAHSQRPEPMAAPPRLVGLVQSWIEQPFRLDRYHKVPMPVARLRSLPVPWIMTEQRAAESTVCPMMDGGFNPQRICPVAEPPKNMGERVAGEDARRSVAGHGERFDVDGVN